MDVVDRLATLIAAVERQAVSRIANVLLIRELVPDSDHAGQQAAVLLCKVADGGDVLLRDDQQVRRRPRIDVADREAEIVIVQVVDRYLAGDHVAE